MSTHISLIMSSFKQYGTHQVLLCQHLLYDTIIMSSFKLYDTHHHLTTDIHEYHIVLIMMT